MNSKRRKQVGKMKDTAIVAENNKAATALSTTGPNAWTEYGEAMGSRAITGDLLKFSKGDYLAGQDSREIAAGTRLTVNMDTLEIGWIKWEDSRPVQYRMGRFVEGFKPAKRNELGDEDRALWEADEEGSPRDPWQFSNNLVMADPEDGELFTFATSSKGGLNAIGELCKAYGQAMRQRPNEWPIVELGVGSYQHRIKTLGRIKYPTLAIVGWAPKEATLPLVASSAPATSSSASTAKPAAKAARF